MYYIYLQNYFLCFSKDFTCTFVFASFKTNSNCSALQSNACSYCASCLYSDFSLRLAQLVPLSQRGLSNLFYKCFNLYKLLFGSVTPSSCMQLKCARLFNSLFKLLEDSGLQGSFLLFFEIVFNAQKRVNIFLLVGISCSFFVLLFSTFVRLRS